MDRIYSLGVTFGGTYGIVDCAYIGAVVGISAGLVAGAQAIAMVCAALF